VLQIEVPSVLDRKDDLLTLVEYLVQRYPFDRQKDAGCEREMIEAALAANRGRVSGPSGAAAKLLGIA
jgi:transcriptional regulator with GAF, ATPase, and Fis domain